MRPAVLIDSLEEALETNKWSAALDLTLKIPSIMGTIDNPNLNPYKRYSVWFDKYVGKRYRRFSQYGGKEIPVLSGKDCHSIYHSYVNGDMFLQSNTVNKRFQFVSPEKKVFQHLRKVDNKIQIQVDYFCTDILEGVKNWLKEISTNKQHAGSDFEVLHY